MSYATAQNMIDRYDKRVLGQLCSDDNSTVASTDLATNARMIAVLADSDAEINNALKQANRYTDAQLAALSAATDKTLIRLACDLALGMLYEARGLGIPDYHTSVVDKARDRLENLRSGKWILPLDAAAEAGLPEEYQPTTVSRYVAESMTAAPVFPLPTPSPFNVITIT